MTVIYLIILGFLAAGHHNHWGSLHPWTVWFVVLVLAAIADLVLHRSIF